MPLSRARWCVLALAGGALLSPGSLASADVIYVDADATGANDGITWEDAFTDLQDALAVAESGDQAWVAGGIYRPAPPGGDREASFQLISGVGLYGGFAGWETSLDERDVEANETVLSGDLNGDDGPDFENNDENSYHVVNGSLTDGTAVLDGFTITAGNGDNGAGLYLGGTASPALTNCTFLRNAASASGGGIFSEYGNPSLLRCSFIENTAMYAGGGMYSNGPSVITNCFFLGNSATSFFGQGGGLFNSSSSQLLINCVFSGNWASFSSGGMHNEIGTPTLINCTFSQNSAGEYGGGLSGHHNDATCINCIFWGNTDSGGMGQYSQTTAAILNYCCIQNWAGSGGGNITEHPLFLDADGPDGVPGTPDDDLRLRVGSPCLDAADNLAVPADEGDLDGDGDTDEPIPLDLDGQPRFVDDPSAADTGNGAPPIVDMGAYEYQGDCNGNGIDDAADIDGGTSSDCNTNGIPDECEIDCDGSGVPDDCEPPLSRFYVDADASGMNNGSSWTDAFNDVQDALADVARCGGIVSEIWVAQGTYTPAPPDGTRVMSFVLADGVALYGGFAGDETKLQARDPTSNATILSGDLKGDDGPGFANSEENSLHVVIASNVDETAILDGFIVRGGNATGGVCESNRGAGVHAGSGSPSIISCILTENFAERFGGGMILDNCNATLINCIFLGNEAREKGAGIYSTGSSAQLIDCVFSGNATTPSYSYGKGGAMYVTGTYDTTSLVNCTFGGNVATLQGGGLYLYAGALELANCVLWSNSDVGGEGQSAQIYWPGGALTIDHSCIAGWTGGWGGVGNIGDDPLFVDPDGLDDTVGTLDDDLRLLPGSPCIDAADNDAVPADEFDLDGDGDTAEPVPLDLDGRSRFVDDPATDDTGNGTSPIVDMGSYEFQMEDFPCDGDANGDGTVDPLDSGFVLSRFGCLVGDGDPDCDAADQNGDGLVDPLDAGFILARFGPCP